MKQARSVGQTTETAGGKLWMILGVFVVCVALEQPQLTHIKQTIDLCKTLIPPLVYQ
jgi:hypothetical protein